MTTANYIYKRKDGGTTYCFGEIVEGANFSIVCDDEYKDGIAADIDTEDKETNTWRRICIYLEKNYDTQIEEIVTC